MSDYAVTPYSEDALPQAISPEGAEIANTYLANACSIKSTSDQLGIPSHEISAMLHEPLVKTYVQSILKETGYRHMVKIAEKLDDLIEKKWEELEEAEIGSNKDIADLLQLAHKMQVDMSKVLQNDSDKGPKIQKNTQINNYGEGNYGKLMDKLING
jgi:hypothetical protein